MTFKFEYCGELDFIFDNILGLETGSQMGLIDEKKHKVRSKISCQCTFNLQKEVQLTLKEKACKEPILMTSRRRELVNDCQQTSTHCTKSLEVTLVQNDIAVKCVIQYI